MKNISKDAFKNKSSSRAKGKKDDAPPNVRFLVYRFLEAIRSVQGDHPRDAEIDQMAAECSTEDRALYHEMTRGISREYGFLEFQVHRLSKGEVKSKTRDLLLMSAYSLLFLDRIPAYAVYSEMKNLCRKINLTEYEYKYLHAILKKIEHNKIDLLADRAKALSQIEKDQTVRIGMERALLQADEELLESFVFNSSKTADDPPQFFHDRKRAVKNLLKMRKHGPVYGFVVPGMRPMKEPRKLNLDWAPNALEVEPKTASVDRAVRIQSLSSQQMCMEVAKQILEKIESSKISETDRVIRRKKIRILEMCAGKGGKCIGILTALKALKDPSVPLTGLEWVACDRSEWQLERFRSSVLPVIEKEFKEISVHVIETNFREIPIDLEEKFDFVLVDAPCSGMGTLRKLPQILVEMRGYYKKRILIHQDEQRYLLERALGFIKKDGRACYSVCTLTGEETEAQLAFLKDKHAIEPILVKTFEPALYDSVAVEGFFYAIF